MVGLRHRILAAAGAGLAALLCGCAASGPQLREFKVTGPALELPRVPYAAEDGHRGGPAALAMALGAAGVPAAPSSLDDEIQRGEEQDDTRTAMVQAVLARGLVPNVIKSPTVDLDVVRELRAGHAVVVLLYRGMLLRYWEYAVIVGVDPGANTFVLHTGTHRHLVLDYPDLLAAWGDSDYWALVVSAPDDVPATVSPPQWLARAGDLERTGKPGQAMQAYLAATRRWPAEPLAWAALGRLRAAQHDLHGATEAFIAALKLAPGAAAIHADFARVLRERQCADQAQDEIGLAVAQERDPGRRAADERLQRELDALAGPSVVCPLD
ncbi:MAG: PA2778 family cysteine peptidase [Nevskia sp.]|nr:PA2778 family cysteine peptidase [Nevskia sp.]